MYTCELNDDFGLFSFLNLEPSRLSVFEELDFDLLERVPEFSLERTASRCVIVPAPMELFCDLGNEKMLAEVETHSTSVQTAPLLNHSKRAMSVLSFDSDAMGSEDYSNPPHAQTLNSSEEGFDKLLLKMVDQECLDFLRSMPTNRFDDKLKEFLACNIEVMTKTSFPPLPGESSDHWIQRANDHLNNTTKKRKDQKLRMIFNKIVKMLVNGSSKREAGRESKALRHEHFLEKYANKTQSEFDAFIKDCKFPSKKKLKSIFKNYPLFKEDFNHILSQKVFYNEYLTKRQLKAQKLVHNFTEAQKKFGAGSSRAKVVTCLRDCIKSFPWSVEDLTTSCDLLHSTLGETILGSHF